MAESEKVAMDVDGMADEKVAYEAVEDNKEEAVDGKAKADDDKEDAADDKKESDDEKKEADKKEEAGADDDEDNKASGPKVSLFDAPLEVTGKRERKVVERIEYEEKEKTKFEIPKGPGVEIGTLPNVCHFLDKKKAEELGWIHRMMFGIPGKKTIIRKNIRKFSGFPADMSAEQKEKRCKNLFAKPIPALKNLAQVFNIEASGKKQDILDVITAFLDSPSDSGRGLQKTPKKASKKSAKKSKKSAKKNPTKVNVGKTAFTYFAIENRDSVKEANAGASKEELLNACRILWEALGDKGQAKYKKMAAPKATSPKKKTATKRKAKSKEEVNEEDEEDDDEADEDDDDSDDSDDDEPLVKKAKKGPSDKELKAALIKHMQGQDLETLTRKLVIAHVSEKYPELDIKERKPFIKECISDFVEAAN